MANRFNPYRVKKKKKKQALFKVVASYDSVWLERVGSVADSRTLLAVVEISRALQHALSLTSCFTRKYVQVQNQIVALKQTLNSRVLLDDGLTNNYTKTFTQVR